MIQYKSVVKVLQKVCTNHGFFFSGNNIQSKVRKIRIYILQAF